MSTNIPVLAFDTESTGIDAFEVRLVTAYLGRLTPQGQVEREQNWIVDPGVEIPAEAASVHGYTTERIRDVGSKDVTGALEQIRDIIEAECGPTGHIPLAGHNLPYDLTLLQCELVRHGLRPLDMQGIAVLDSLVLDKALDRFRKGSRKLVDAAAHYGVPITAEEAHEARADAVAAGRIVQQLLTRPGLLGLPMQEIHHRQIQWKREQAEGLQTYFRTRGNKPDAIVNSGWPLADPTQRERTAA